MLVGLVIVLVGLNVLQANEHLITFDADILKSLEISSSLLSTLISYNEFELYNNYQCAIECFKDRKSCTGYSFNVSNNLCSLYDDTNQIINNDLIELRKKLQPNPCDNIQCNRNAICIGDDEPRCVCLNGEPTPEDCDKIDVGIWSDFDEWSSCSVTCGEGYQYRKRQCLSANNQNEKISSEKCIGQDMEIQPCEVTTCPIYGPWSPWTPCSTFCGIGVKQRNRSCIPPGSNCGNYTFEQRACGEATCQRVVGIKETESGQYPLKGYLAVREGDILCIPQDRNHTVKHMADLTCKLIGFARGAQYAILNPIRHNSTCFPGIICDGTEKSFYDCKYDRTRISSNIRDLFAIVTRCIVDGGFSPWSKWSTCTKTCDTGQTTRFRTCTEPTPSILEPETAATDSLLAGMNCTGEYTQTKTCNEQKC